MPGFLKIATILVGVLLTGCVEPERSGGQTDAGEHALGHVHGLGTDPADGTLYVASHSGVFAVSDDGTVRRVADRWQDTMAFTVVGPRHFLASGHPDLREDLPPHLGLIESTDGAETWEPVSLLGEADFHALEPAGRRLYGYDAVSGQLLMSADHRRWQRLDATRLVDLAVDPGDVDRVLATAPDSTVWEYHVGTGHPPRQMNSAPPVVFLDWPTPDLLVGLGPDGSVFRSRDGGGTWTPTQQPPGRPQAVDAGTGRWHVATSHGVYVSTDDGRSWNLLVGHGS